MTAARGWEDVLDPQEVLQLRRWFDARDAAEKGVGADDHLEGKEKGAEPGKGKGKDKDSPKGPWDMKPCEICGKLLWEGDDESKWIYQSVRLGATMWCCPTCG